MSIQVNLTGKVALITGASEDIRGDALDVQRGVRFFTDDAVNARDSAWWDKSGAHIVCARTNQRTT